MMLGVGEFFFFGTISLWPWVVPTAFAFVGGELCVMVVLAFCYLFKEERDKEEERERNEE